MSSLSGRIPYLKELFLKDKSLSNKLIEESTNKRGNTKGTQSLEYQTHVAPDDEEEISKLKTGEDAIAFFSTASKNSMPISIILSCKIHFINIFYNQLL